MSFVTAFRRSASAAFAAATTAGFVAWFRPGRAVPSSTMVAQESASCTRANWIWFSTVSNPL
ncbi:hypothetical protein B7R22_07845 [Subtercola boreus]|uniref:Secreted protein n=1 Tax=Subtercola boreus TaxID=120213 RepID=A0A3E0VYF9_9MICO|nr:hypothetical protein [Subtercola boreus]RFA14635.1 hypothetical protein B7R22_07845 [Subtercola boreus]